MKLLPVTLVLALGVASPARAGQIALSFSDGFVTLSVKDAPVRDVLAEWARRGQTRIVNGEKLPSGAVTLELVHVPEKQALEVLLRSASGYMAAPRTTAMAANVSSFDRIVVMPTSSAAPPPAAAAFRAPMPQPQGQGDPNAFQGAMPMPVPVDDQDEPVSPGFPVNDGSNDPNAQPQPGLPFGPMPAQPDPQNPARPFGNQGDPNAQTGPVAEPPPPPGPTPATPGMLTTPTPGQMPTPAAKPPQ
jgi:hypothetical protein